MKRGSGFFELSMMLLWRLNRRHDWAGIGQLWELLMELLKGGTTSSEMECKEKNMSNNHATTMSMLTANHAAVS